jgi:signal transduction histidine kinase/ActR/RegA family two-component response regulator
MSLRQTLGGTVHVVDGVIVNKLDDPDVKAIVVHYQDITDFLAIQRRAAVLSEITALLAESLDSKDTLQQLVRSTAEHFADICVVYAMDSAGRFYRAATASSNRAKSDALSSLHSLPVSQPLQDLLASIVARGEPFLRSELTPEAIESFSPVDYGEAIKRLRLVSTIFVPLVARGRRLGALSLTLVEGDRRYSEDDVDFVRELAQRAAVAIDNERLYRELQDAGRRKNEFLATLGHELRNPLAALKLCLHLALQDTQVQPQLKGMLTMMDREVVQLVRLVDDLLDIGRISAGKIELRVQALRLPQILAKAMEEVRSSFESRRHEVVVQIRPGHHVVRGDSARLTQVIGNLLENAAKYTDPGGRIHVTVLQEEGEEILRVADNGIGIPAQELPQVFDLFSQVRIHQGKNADGLGIGLTIVRRLVELHGGSVQAASAGLGSGSTFTVRLPMATEPPSSPTSAEDAQPEVKANQVHRRVLVVDDNETAAIALANILRLDGHGTWVAHDGCKAVEIATATELDVVLMDLSMPGLDGIETAKRIRMLDGCQQLPIVAITGWGQESDRARTREAGFSWHLVKPINMALLSEIFNQLAPAVKK